MSTKLSAKRYTGDQHHRDLIQMEQAAVEQQKRNLEAERREFQQQVKQIQDQMAQQKRELSAAQITLQRQQQALQNEQLALQFAQQELQNSQHEVDQQRKENYAFKQELLQQHSTLLRAREDMARKEKERRLRRTPSEGFLEDAYPSHGTIDVLKLLGNGSSRIRRQAAKSLLECTNSGGDSVSPTIEYGILQTHFLPIIPPIIAETSSADVKEFARALLKTPSFALALVEKGQSQRVVALLKEDQPYDLSEAAKICLSSVLSRRDTSSLPSGRIIRNELAMEVEHIHSPAGLSLLQSTAEATIKDLLEDKNYDLVTKYMLHEVSEVRQAVAPYLNSTITATGSHSARLVVQGSFLSRLCQRFLLPRKSGPENREKLPSDILTLTTTYLPRLCRPLCSTDVQTTSLMVQLIFSNKPSPSSQAITGAAIEATVNAASASKGMEVRQSLVDAGLLEAIAFALSDSPGGTDAPGGSVYSFICQIIPLVGVVAAATNPSHVSSLLNLLRVEDPDASKDLISSLTECFRVTIFSEGQAAYNLASQLEPNLLAPSPEWEPILSSVLPRAFDLRWTTDPEGDGFNWDTLFAIELLKNSSSKEVRKRAGIALLTRFRASPGVINWVCKRGQHPQIIELCTSPQYDEVKRIGCELLRTPAVGSHISVSKGDFTDSRSLKTSEVYGSADLVSLVSHPDMSVRISSYVALLDAARATDNCRIQLAKAGLASALNDITLVHYKGEEQSIQFTLDMLDELFFIWMEGNGHLRDAEVLANMLAAEEEKVASKAFYLTRQSFSEDLGSRQHLRTAILSRVLTVGVEPSSFLAYAAISIAECYAFDLFKIHEFETIFGLLQHPEPRIRNAMTLSMAKALRDDQQPNNGDGKLCEHLVRAGFFELVLGLLEHKDPTKEIIDFTVRSTGLELIALAVVQYGGLRGIWSLVETHPNVSVRAAAAKAIEKISNSVAAEDRALLVGGKVSTWGDDASEKQFYLVSSVCRLVGGTSRIESHIENLCRTSFPKIALQTAVSDDLPQLVVLLNHTNTTVSRSATTALDAILSSDPATRGPLRKHLLASSAKARDEQCSYTAKAVKEVLALDVVQMRDFGEVLAALRYPHEIRAPIFGHAFARIADDASWRKDMISAGFVHSFTQALSQDPLPEKDVLEFLARCVEVASIEIGRSGHTPDILKMCSHQDPTISMAVLNGLASISVNGTPDDRVRLIQDGFLEESLHFCSQDSLSPGVLSLLQQSVPALSHAILNESRVSTFLIPALCNKHEPVWELSYSALHDILSSGDDSSDMMRAQIWPTISHSPLVVCNFIEQALHLRWANDLSNARSVHLLYELLPHTHLGIRTEAMRQLAEIATLEDFQEALVDTGVFEVLLTLIGDSRQDVRLSSNNLLPVLGIAFAQGGKLSVLQKLLFSSDSLISSSTYSAIRTILETGEEKHYWKLIESGLVPDLLSGTTAKPSEKLVILLDMSLNKLGSFLLLNGSGNILFEVLESNRAPRLQATSEEVLKALANGTPRHRRLVWDLLLPRLKSKPERLCMAASAMLSHRLAADRVDSKEYVVMYELLGHPHPAIRKPIMDEFGQLITGENIDIRANEIIVDLLNVLLQLTSSTTAFPDVVSFTGEIFLPKTGLALCHLGKLATIVNILDHHSLQLRKGSCLALQSIAQGPEKHKLLPAGILAPCCNMERLVGDGNLTRLVCVLVPNITEFVKKPDELGSLFKLFSHPDEAVTSMISESLSQMMQTEGQDFILLSFILEQLPVHENSQLFVSKAIRVMGGEGAFYRTRQTSVLLEFLSSDAPYLSNSAQDAVIALAKSDDLAYKQNLVDSKIMSYLEKLNLSDIHRPVGLALSCSVLPSLCALSMSSGQGLEVVNMFFDSYEPLRRIIDAQWQELVKTPQGVSVLVRENVVPLVLQRIGHSVGHFAIPLVCYLSRRCGNSLVLRKQGWLFLDMMDSRDDELTKAGILNLLALSEGSEEHAAMIFDVPRIRERLASALDSLYEPETIVDILHVVQNLVRGSSMRSERCLFSPVSTCVYKHTRSAVRSIRLTSLHILYNIFLSITDKMSMIDEDLVEALHTTLTTSQDNETYAAALRIIVEACRVEQCREVIGVKKFVTILLEWAKPEQDTACRRLAWEAIANIAKGSDEDRLQLVDSSILTFLTPLIRHNSSDVAKFAIETVGSIGQSGAFYRNVAGSGAVRKLEHVTSPLHRSKLDGSEDRKGTKEAAAQALKWINSAKKRSHSSRIRNRNEAPLINRSSVRLSRQVIQDDRPHSPTSGSQTLSSLQYTT